MAASRTGGVADGAGESAGAVESLEGSERGARAGSGIVTRVEGAESPDPDELPDVDAAGWSAEGNAPEDSWDPP